MIAEGLRAPRFFSPFRSQTPIKITPKEFYPKSNSMIPCLWNNADKPGEDGGVKEMLDMSIAVFITWENLQIQNSKLVKLVKKAAH